MFFIDREGKLVKKHVGMLDARTTDLEARSLAGLPVKATVELVEEDDKVRLENAAQANKIPGIDLQPCGGTHVLNIGEIKGIRVVKIRNEGKRNKRVEIVLVD